MTAREVRLEAEDKAEGRHWDWAGGCWCGKLPEDHDACVVLFAPPWHPSRLAEPFAAVAS